MARPVEGYQPHLEPQDSVIDVRHPTRGHNEPYLTPLDYAAGAAIGAMIWGPLLAGALLT
jgi:hypothetical protein